MQANTKLSTYAKAARKTLKREMGATLVNNGETTIAYIDRGNTVEFALAVTAPTEKKFRRKVGEFHALNRFNDGETVKMKRDDFDVMMAYVYR